MNMASTFIHEFINWHDKFLENKIIDKLQLIYRNDINFYVMNL